MALSDQDLTSAAEAYITRLHANPDDLNLCLGLTKETEKLAFMKRLSGYDVDSADAAKMREIIQKNHPAKWSELTERSGNVDICLSVADQ